MTAQQLRLKRMVVRAYERAKSREQIRRLGHPLPDPTDLDDLWRHRFEDAVYGLVVGREPARQVRHLTVFPGGNADDLTGLGQEGLGPDMNGGGPAPPPSQHTTRPSHLPGGSDTALRRPRRQKGQELVAGGCKPPAVVETQPPGRPDPVFELDEETF